MKNLKLLIVLISGFFWLSQTLQAQKIKTVEIKTSAQCEMCKERLESNLIFEKGIKDVSLDMENKKISIMFNIKKTNIEKIKKAISNLGYDADDVIGNKEAYKNLPMCCKKPADRANISHE